MERIAIVGAGIGGLAAAAALEICDPRATFDVEVFERRAEVRGLGAGLTLWANATRVLQQLGALDGCLSQSGPLLNLRVQLWNGRPVMQIPVERFSTPSFAMHRADLHHVLRSRVSRSTFFPASHCIGVSELDDGAELEFADGRKRVFDIVIAADGINSVLRNYVQRPRKLNFNGYGVWRGVADGRGLIEQDGNFYEIWGRGRRFGILPMADHQVCWYATENHAGEDT